MWFYDFLTHWHRISGLLLVAVYTGGRSATSEDLTMVGNILSVAGISEMVPEYLINAAGALAGSGPAFVSKTSIGDSFWAEKDRLTVRIVLLVINYHVANNVQKMLSSGMWCCVTGWAVPTFWRIKVPSCSGSDMQVIVQLQLMASQSIHTGIKLQGKCVLSRHGWCRLQVTKPTAICYLHQPFFLQLTNECHILENQNF